LEKITELAVGFDVQSPVCCIIIVCDFTEWSTHAP